MKCSIHEIDWNGKLTWNYWTLKAKIETRALKAKRPGFSEERYNETEYYFENGESHTIHHHSSLIVHWFVISRHFRRHFTSSHVRKCINHLPPNCPLAAFRYRFGILATSFFLSFFFFFFLIININRRSRIDHIAPGHKTVARPREYLNDEAPLTTGIFNISSFVFDIDDLVDLEASYWSVNELRINSITKKKKRRIATILRFEYN